MTTLITTPFGEQSTAAEVIAGTWEGQPSCVRAYAGATFAGKGEPAAFQDLDPFGRAAFADGIYVG